MSEETPKLCSQPQTLSRIMICGSCKSNVLEEFPLCKECNVSISQLTSELLQSCPIGKWK